MFRLSVFEDASQLLASPPRANSARSDPALADQQRVVIIIIIIIISSSSSSSSSRQRQDEQSPPPELPFLSEAHQRQLREAVDRGKDWVALLA